MAVRPRCPSAKIELVNSPEVVIRPDVVGRRAGEPHRRALGAPRRVMNRRPLLRADTGQR